MMSEIFFIQMVIFLSAVPETVGFFFWAF